MLNRWIFPESGRWKSEFSRFVCLFFIGHPDNYQGNNLHSDTLVRIGERLTRNCLIYWIGGGKTSIVQLSSNLAREFHRWTPTTIRVVSQTRAAVYNLISEIVRLHKAQWFEWRTERSDIICLEEPLEIWEIPKFPPSFGQSGHSKDLDIPNGSVGQSLFPYYLSWLTTLSSIMLKSQCYLHLKNIIYLHTFWHLLFVNLLLFFCEFESFANNGICKWLEKSNFFHEIFVSTALKLTCNECFSIKWYNKPV